MSEHRLVEELSDLSERALLKPLLELVRLLTPLLLPVAHPFRSIERIPDINKKNSLLFDFDSFSLLKIFSFSSIESFCFEPDRIDERDTPEDPFCLERNRIN